MHTHVITHPETELVESRDKLRNSPDTLSVLFPDTTIRINITVSVVKLTCI